MEQLQPANSALRAQEAVTFSRDKHFEREAVVDERLLMRAAQAAEWARQRMSKSARTARTACGKVNFLAHTPRRERLEGYSQRRRLFLLNGK
jgi:hypothetical protein